MRDISQHQKRPSLEKAIFEKKKLMFSGHQHFRNRIHPMKTRTMWMLNVFTATKCVPSRQKMMGGSNVLIACVGPMKRALVVVKKMITLFVNYVFIKISSRGELALN